VRFIYVRLDVKHTYVFPGLSVDLKGRCPYMMRKGCNVQQHSLSIDQAKKSGRVC